MLFMCIIRDWICIKVGLDWIRAIRVYMREAFLNNLIASYVSSLALNSPYAF